METDFDDHERRMWAGRADAYERTFAKLCAHPASALLDAANVMAGMRVLDVGTGPGTVAVMACARGAVVTAVDAEPSMLDAARRNVPGADVRHATLPDLEFPDGSFDAAVANFVLNHVGNPSAAIAELGRVVRPGGCIAVTIWPHPPAPLQSLWGQVLDAAGACRPATVPTVSSDLDFPRTCEGLRQLLLDAKIADVSCDTITWKHRVDPEEWWAGPASGLATIGQVITSQTPDMIAQIKYHYDRLSARYLTSDRLLLVPTAALLASGRAT
jgi:SAM-dependent methyltransferase